MEASGPSSCSQWHGGPGLQTHRKRKEGVRDSKDADGAPQGTLQPEVTSWSVECPQLRSGAWCGEAAPTLLLPCGAPPRAREVPVPGWIKTPVSWMFWSQHSRQLASTPHPGSASLCLVQKHICSATSVAFEFILIFVILAILLNLRA